MAGETYTTDVGGHRRVEGGPKSIESQYYCGILVVLKMVACDAHGWKGWRNADSKEVQKEETLRLWKLGGAQDGRV